MKKRSGTYVSLLLALVVFLLALQPVQAFGSGDYHVSGDYVYEVIDGKASIVQYDGNAAEVVVPDRLDGLTVYRIDANAFAAPETTRITIPASVTLIEPFAFGGCESLQALVVNAANPAYSSENGALFDKTKTAILQFPAKNPAGSYAIPGSVVRIEEHAFYGCSNLTSVIVPDSVKTIAYGAFMGCESLKFLHLGSGVSEIGGWAFADCAALANVQLPAGLASIGEFAFAGCALKNLDIPASVTTIEPGAFSDCAALGSITVNAASTTFAAVGGVLYDKSRAVLLAYPAGKTDPAFTVPTGTELIVEFAFAGCGYLESVALPGTMTEVSDGAFEDCHSLKTVSIPAGVTRIGMLAFAGCESLQSIALPAGVSEIASYAFLSCQSLTDVIIPDTVAVIGDSAFSDCGGLREAYFMGNAPTLGEFAFAYTDPAFTVYYLAAKTGFSRPLWNGYTANTFKLVNQVGFDSHGGSAVAPVSVDFNRTIAEPAQPTRTAYAFGGWYRDAVCTQRFNFATEPVRSDLVLHAKWTLNSQREGIEAFVTRFYQLFFNRAPDDGGLAYWTNALMANQTTGASAAAFFVDSTEFKAMNVSDSAYLDMMYRAFFSREPDSAGKAYWQGFLDNGMTRYWVLHNFVNSGEFQGICTEYGIVRGSLTLTKPADLYPKITAFVTRFYKLTLERMPDEGGLNYWVKDLADGKKTGAGLANDFITSQEFVARNTTNEQFVTIMYRAFFGREPEAGGFSYWVGELQSGRRTRKAVLAGFVYSNEFQGICNDYGIVRGTLP